MDTKRIRPKGWYVAVALVLAGGAGAALHWHALDSRRAALASLEVEIRRVSEENAVAEQAARELPALRAAASRFAARVPANPDIGELLGPVGSDGSATGAPEREIVTKPTVAGQTVSRVPFLLQYRGSFAGTVGLLRRLHEGPLLTHVERVMVESESPTGGDKPLRVEVEFSTFAGTSKEVKSWAKAE